MGILHLDIKPDNVVLNSNAVDDPKSSKITLIDYNISQQETLITNILEFKGNVLFSSSYQMIF